MRTDIDSWCESIARTKKRKIGSSLPLKETSWVEDECAPNKTRAAGRCDQELSKVFHWSESRSYHLKRRTSVNNRYSSQQLLKGSRNEYQCRWKIKGNLFHALGISFLALLQSSQALLTPHKSITHRHLVTMSSVMVPQSTKNEVRNLLKTTSQQNAVKRSDVLQGEKSSTFKDRVVFPSGVSILREQTRISWEKNHGNTDMREKEIASDICTKFSVLKGRGVRQDEILRLPTEKRQVFSFSEVEEGFKRSTPAVRSRRTTLTKEQPRMITTPTKTMRKTKSEKIQRKSSTMPGYSDERHRVRSRIQRGKSLKEREGKSLLPLDVESNLEMENRAARQAVNTQRLYQSSNMVPDSFLRYVAEIHKETSCLSAKQESELGTLIQEGIRVQEIYDELFRELGREPTNGEWARACAYEDCDEHDQCNLLKKVIQQGMEAKKVLVLSNLRMVQRVVNLYIRNGLGSEYNAGDLMQEGTLALIRAAEKFEPKRGFRFSTYAMYWIRSSVKRSQVLQSSPIHVPQRLHENHKKVQKMIVKLEQTLGRKPTAIEVANEVGLSLTQLERCVSAMKQQCFSLDAEIKNGHKPNDASSSRSRVDTMYDIVSEAKADDGEKFRVERLFMRDDLIASMRRHLSPHEVDLILLRFGLMDERTLPHGFSGPLTISEVSRLVGIKPDKVRRLINNSLRKLKNLIAHEWAP